MTSVLGRMDHRFVLQASEPPATADDIADLSSFAKSLGWTLPGDYLDLLRDATEAEIVVDKRGCIRFWSPSGVLEMNKAHDLQSYLPEAIAVADDEGGAAFAFMVGPEGRGIYRTSFSAPDPTEAVFIAESVEALLVRAVGVDRLFGWV